jgi:D-galactarolactone cycloisomerase
MRITQIDLWHVAIPLGGTFYSSWIPGFPQTENRFTLVRLRTASGLDGYSAGPSMGRERAGLGALLGPYLLNERADDLLTIRQRIREMGYLGLRLGWLECACWDVVGKARGRPVWQLLAPEAKAGDVKVYASTGQVRSGEDRVKEVEARLAEGFDTVKLRVHAMTLEEDLEHLRITRKGVGDRVTLGVDANQAWRVAVVADAPKWDFARAKFFCDEAHQLGFEWVEEPLAMDDYAGLAKLRESIEVDLTGGELNSQGRPEFQVMLEKGCYDVYQPDACFTGGIAETWQIMQDVKAAGMRYTPHTWTNGIGFAINLQLFGASPWRDEQHLEYPTDAPWLPEARDGILTHPFLPTKGHLALPTTPGLGFDIDPRKLRRFGSHYYKATKARVAWRTVRDRGLSAARETGKVRDERLAARNEVVEAMVARGEDPALQALEP